MESKLHTAADSIRPEWEAGVEAVLLYSSPLLSCSQQPFKNSRPLFIEGRSSSCESRSVKRLGKKLSSRYGALKGRTAWRFPARC
jgi:hypothetical protein